MELPYGYVLIDKKIAVDDEKADVVRSIFEHYLTGASLGKIVDILFTKGVPSPTGNAQWSRAAIDKLLTNKKYVPIVGVKVYMDAQFEKNRRCNVDYDKAGHPRKTARYQSPHLEMMLYPSRSFCYTYIKRSRNHDRGRCQQALHTLGVSI